MKYIETIYILDTQDMMQYLERELPQLIHENYIRYELEQVIEFMIGRSLRDALYHLTHKDYCVMPYYDDVCENVYDAIKHVLMGKMMRMIHQHQIQFQQFYQVRYLVTQVGLFLAIKKRALEWMTT